MKWIILLFFLVSTFAHATTINVLNWSGYLSSDTLKQFEAKTGIHVNYNTYDSNDELYTKIKLQPGTYDLIVPSSYMIARMRKQGLLEKIDKSKLNYLKDINPFLLNTPDDPNSLYDIPYFWGSTGIAINTLYFKKSSIDSWRDLWQKRFHGKLILPDEAREVFGATLKSLGYSSNDENPKHIKEAYLKIKALLPNVKLFNEDAESNLFIDEDVTAGIILNGDADHAHHENKFVQFIYPKEGVIVWLDAMAIPKNAPHLKATYQFINFIMQPKIAKEIALSMGYSSPNLAAIKLMPAAVQHNLTLYPKKYQLKHATFESEMSNKMRTLMENYWLKLKLEA